LHGPEAFSDLYRTFVSAFPDLHFEVTHVVAEDDYVSVRSIQTGNFLGMVPPTNKKVTWTGTAIFRFTQEGNCGTLAGPG
jgi:predicted ester cyclase